MNHIPVDNDDHVTIQMFPVKTIHNSQATIKKLLTALVSLLTTFIRTNIIYMCVCVCVCVGIHIHYLINRYTTTNKIKYKQIYTHIR